MCKFVVYNVIYKEDLKMIKIEDIFYNMVKINMWLGNGK